MDLATRMLPAFDTQSGLPSLWVNLAKGQNKADTNVTCTACAGTLLLEFGLLSSLSGVAPGPQGVHCTHGLRRFWSLHRILLARSSICPLAAML